MSYLAFPTPAYFEIHNYSQLKFSNDYSLLKPSVLSLEIFYNFDTKIIDYNVKCSIHDIISDIGGILECFLGASLISMVEIIELLIEIVFKILNRKTKPVQIQK